MSYILYAYDELTLTLFGYFFTEPIKFLDTSPVQVANESESVVMRCEVEGEPEPSISWSAKGKTPDGKLLYSYIKGILFPNI